MGNILGRLFRITTFGESHGKMTGVVIDGCPPGMPLEESDIQIKLDKRKPGQSNITSPRQEQDKVQIVSGVYQGKTLGTPIALLIPNEDQKPEDYQEIAQKLRPSHADFTTLAKYGFRTPLGGGRSSARETAARVAAGAIAQKLLHFITQIEILTFVDSVLNIFMQDPHASSITPDLIEKNVIRCPEEDTANRMVDLIQKVKNEGDSVGGTIFCRIKNLPAGLGSPVFDKLEADLAKAMLSLPATKGFEVGSGFHGAACLKGSEHNDLFIPNSTSSTPNSSISSLKTSTNYSGGIQGGISNGMDIYFRVAFKPTSTLSKEQPTVDIEGNIIQLKVQGRHDPCVLPRAVPIVEAMAALVLIDHLLLHHAQCKTLDFTKSYKDSKKDTQ